MGSTASELPLVEPGGGTGLFAVFRRRYLLKLLVRKELRVRYRGSMLGMLWSYVKPATQFIVFYIALGVFLELNRSTEAYAVYLFSGIVVINFFSEGFGNSTRSVVGNSALVRKIYLPREMFPVSAIWVAAVHFFPQLIVLLLGTLLAGWRPSALNLAAGVLQHRAEVVEDLPFVSFALVRHATIVPGGSPPRRTRCPAGVRIRPQGRSPGCRDRAPQRGR